MADLHNELLEASRNYKMPAKAIELLAQNPPIIIAAITGGGKTTVAQRIIENSSYSHVVAHTTRPMRPGEINGLNYWFVNEAEMLSMIKAGSFVETQPVHSDVYGTSVNAYRAVIEGGHKPLMTIDVQGVQEIITGVPDIKPIFILPPNYEAWDERLQGRGAMSHTEKSRRLLSAQQEITAVLNDPHFVLVVNYDIDRTAEEILDGPTMVNQHKGREIALNLLENIKNY